MPSIVVSVLMDASMAEVWDALSDLAGHAEWMADAESIEFETASRSGRGTRMRVATRIGPLRTTDLMVVTDWEEGRSIGVAHEGLVSGTGRFVLTPMGGGARLSWTEQLSFPWWLGGRVTAWCARPVLAAVWRRNLDRLKARVEGP